MIGFVHITKTGGTSIEQYFQKHCSKFIVGMAHDNTEKHFEKRNMTVLTILREPVDRFFSQFYYWRDGSTKGKYIRRSIDINENNRLYRSVGEFINASIDNSYYTNFITNHKMGFTWNVHFFQQKKWLNGKHKNTYIICYNTNLMERTQSALRAMNSICNVSNLPKINPTLHVKENLSYVQFNWLKNKYNPDFDLWNKHCSRNQFFSKI